jgi:SAM-dependent methyltransferase
MGEALARGLAGCDSVLDVGCGQGGPILRIPKPPQLTGLDGFAPSLEALRAAGGYDHLVLGRLDDDALFGPASFDAVVALDVIEHFTEPEALALVARLERWARRTVILSTPNGFLPQGPVGGNPHQEHRCGFSPAQLRALGYQVHGLHGPKPLRGELGELRWWPKPFWYRVGGLLQDACWDRPDWAFSLLALKDRPPA